MTGGTSMDTSISSSGKTFGFSGGCQMIESSELTLQKMIGAGAYGKGEFTDTY
eukprot:gene18694-25215_t